MIRTLRNCAYAKGYRAFVRQWERNRVLRAENELLRTKLFQVSEELSETHRAVRRLEGRYHDLRGAIPEVIALRAACDEHARDYERLEASYRRLEIENRDLRRAMAEAIATPRPWPTEDTGELRAPSAVHHHGSIADCPICRHPDPRSGVGPITVIDPVLGRPRLIQK